MADTFTINLKGPVRLVKILDDYHVSSAETQSAQATWRDLERQKTEVAQLCQTLNRLVSELTQFYDEVLATHREEIARLSVQIANKVLMQKVQKGDYHIESIVKEALRNAPTRQELLVHLNPEDLKQYQKLQQDEPNNTLADIQFVADANIGRAECLLESPKGIVKSFIDENIERISEALAKVQ